MTPQDIKDKKEKIDSIHQEFVLKLSALETEQREIIKEYARALEKRKIETLRNTINSNDKS